MKGAYVMKFVLTSFAGILLSASAIFAMGEDIMIRESLQHSERLIYVEQGWGALGLGTCAYAPGTTPLPMRIGDAVYNDGLGTHAVSKICVELDASCMRFEAVVGVQPEQAGGSVIFSALLDDRLVFETAIVRSGDPPIRVSLDVRGGQILTLLVNDAGDGIVCDAAHWAQARLLRDPAIIKEPNAKENTVDLVPFAQIFYSDKQRLDGAHNGRFDPFPLYELNFETLIQPNSDGIYHVPIGMVPGFRWAERRRIRRVELEFEDADEMIAPELVSVQRWVMNAYGITPGGSRWQGRWEPLPGKLHVEGSRLIHEVKWSGDFTHRNEGAMKIRWMFKDVNKPVAIRKMSAYSETPWMDNIIELRAERPIGKIAWSIYNGIIIDTQKQTQLNGLWDGASPLQLNVRHAASRPWPSDRTDLRFELENGSGFAIAIEDILKEGCVYIKSYGIWATILPSNETINAYRMRFEGTQTLLERVRKSPDQTLEQAMRVVNWADARQGPTVISLACDNRKFLVGRAGDVQFETDKAVYDNADSFSGVSYSHCLTPRLGFEMNTELYRWLENGWAPVLRFERREHGVLYQMRAYVAPAGEAIAGAPLWFNQQPLFVMEIEAINETSSPTRTRLQLGMTYGQGVLESSVLNNDLDDDEPKTWLWQEKGSLIGLMVTKGAMSGIADGMPLIETSLNPGTSAAMTVFIPAWNGATPEILGALDVKKLRASTFSYWDTVLASSMQISIPNMWLMNIIRANQVHCLLAARNIDHNLIAPWIGSMHYGPLESESQSVLRGMAAMGHLEFAKRGHDYFISHYTKEGFIRPTYTIMGTGWHLWMLGEFVAFSGNVEWMRSHADEVAKVCDWVDTQISKTGELGLFPPGAMADWEMFAFYFYMNGYFYAGLEAAGQALEMIDHPSAPKFLATADKLRASIREAFHAIQAKAPVVQLQDGTWVPFYPTHAECPGPVESLYPGEDAGRSWAYDVDLGSHHLIPQGVLDPMSADAEWITNHFEDIQCLRDGWGRYPSAQSKVDWFNFGGFTKVQPYYARFAEIYALRDDIKPYIRSYFNALASLLNPEDLSIWEHFFVGAYSKTHETGGFLHQTRMMFVLEREKELWLAPFMSDVWQYDGAQIEVRQAPTRFGEVAYGMTVTPNEVQAWIEPPVRESPETLILRIRPMDGRAIGHVLAIADGEEISVCYDAKTQTIRMSQPPKTRIELTAFRK